MATDNRGGQATRRRDYVPHIYAAGDVMVQQPASTSLERGRLAPAALDRSAKSPELFPTAFTHPKSRWSAGRAGATERVPYEVGKAIPRNRARQIIGDAPDCQVLSTQKSARAGGPSLARKPAS